MKKILFTIYILLIVQIAIAQNTLRGVVFDKTSGEKINNASVFIPELNKRTTTNNKGEYFLSGFGKGNFAIEITSIGYANKTTYINFNGTDITFNAELLKATRELNEVVVTSPYTNSQSSNPQKIDVVSINEMQKNGASSVMDLISKVPGVDAITTGPLVSRPVI